MGDKRVDLVEGSGIEQERDTFAGSELAGLVLSTQAFLTTAELGEAQQLLERPARHRCANPLNPTNLLTPPPSSTDQPDQPVHPTAGLDLRDSLRLLPVLQEFLEADVGQRVFE